MRRSARKMKGPENGKTGDHELRPKISEVREKFGVAIGALKTILGMLGPWIEITDDLEQHHEGPEAQSVEDA